MKKIKKNVEEEEDIIDSKPKTVIVGDKVLRATKARERKDTESETASSQTSSRNTVSRNSEWENETTRSLRPRRQATNYAETSFVEEKSLKSKSKILVLPPQIKVKVKEEIRERYDDFCSDSRILGSLRPVKFEACENSEMTIDLLKSNLHKVL
uniref:Uncharacterized protein n=1 Tax=Panagrolaimus superbus TaxID=310955 RepID=A0A914YBQ8_9BILA